MNEHIITQDEINEIMNPREFRDKYLYNKDSLKNSKDIEGETFWISCFAGNNGNSVQRNQKPELVIVKLNDKGYPEFFKLNKNGTPSSKKVKFVDNAGNMLYVCYTKRQAEYAYNKGVQALLLEQEYKIKNLVALKNKCENMILPISNF